MVIGGTALSGGRATIVGTFLGVVTFALIFNLLTIMNVAIEIQQITKGAIILAAVLIQRKRALTGQLQIRVVRKGQGNEEGSACF